MMTEAKAYTSEIYDDESADFKTEEKIAETIADFCAGWQEADRTRWISVKDELPKHDEEERLITFPYVLVCLSDGCVTKDYYDDMEEEWGDYDGDVEYWMPMPPAPGKKE